MKKFNLYLLLILSFGSLTLNSCKKKVTTLEQFFATNCLKAKEVRENGTIVYSIGGANNTKPGYAAFRIETVSSPSKAVTITELGGIVTKGIWSFADNKITISGLNPPLTDAITGTNTRTTAEYSTSNYSPKTKEVTVTALTKNLKSGDFTVVYVLIPCN
jgi:hypothetical protein